MTTSFFGYFSSFEARLFAVGRSLYAPIAQRFGATEAAVERLIRHAV